MIYKSKYCIGDDVLAFGIPGKIVGVCFRGYPLVSATYEVSYVNKGQLVVSTCIDCELESSNGHTLGFKKEQVK